jgi:hypothetical protein
MNKQEVFDKVATHLLTQNAKAMLPEDEEYPVESCAYRAPDGKMCAVGCLIDEKLYDPSFERNSIDDRYLAEAISKSGVPNEAWQLITDLQWLHDARYPEKWESGLQEIADKHSLDSAVLYA